MSGYKLPLPNGVVNLGVLTPITNANQLPSTAPLTGFQVVIGGSNIVDPITSQTLLANNIYFWFNGAYELTGGAGGSGSVSSFSSGNLSPLFTTSVTNPSTTPTLSYALSTQTANKVLAGPSSGSAAGPTFRSLVLDDMPAGLGDVTGPNSSTAQGLASYLDSTGNVIESISNISTNSNSTLTGGAGEDFILDVPTGSNRNIQLNPDGTGQVLINSHALGITSANINMNEGAIQYYSFTGNVAPIKVGVLTSDNTYRVSANDFGSLDLIVCDPSFGQVTFPNNPLFSAYLASTVTNKTGTGASYQLGTDAMTVIFDQASNFNTNGTFTAFAAGNYEFSAGVSFVNCTVATTFTIAIITTARTYTQSQTRAAGNGPWSLNMKIIADMSANDTAVVSVAVAGEAGNTVGIGGGAAVMTYFMGKLA